MQSPRPVLRVATALALIMLASSAWAFTIPTAARGGKVVSMQAAQGELTITMHKRDLNIYSGADVLTAVLFTAQGTELGTLTIPDDGKLEKGGGYGEPQTAQLTVAVEEAGICRLQIAGAGGDFVWGLEANVDRAVVAGDITFSHGEPAGQLYFMPPAKAFKIMAYALHDPGRGQMPLYDDKGELIHQFDLSTTGEEQTLEVEEGERGGVWRFDIEHLDVKMEISGVKQWTTEPDAHFVAEDLRWLLLPYRQARYLNPGDEAVIEWTLRNTGKVASAFELSVKADDGLMAEILEPDGAELFKSGASVKVLARVTAAAGCGIGDALGVSLIATSIEEPELTVSRAVEIRVGESPVGKPLDLPITLRRYEHENVQFGYAPDYMTNEVYFNEENRPFIRERTVSMYGTNSLFVLEDDGWIERPFIDAIRAAFPDYRTAYGGGGFQGAKWAFDGEGWAYTIVRGVLESTRQSMVIYTPDRGETFLVEPLPGSAFDIEQFTGHNALDRVPPILTYTFTEAHPARFAGYNDLNIYLPEKRDGALELGEPIFVAPGCLGSCQHSGGPASMATRGGKTHIVWGEIAPDDAPGVPTYVATLDHATRTVGAKVLLGYGPPVNDVHNVPAVTQDSEGYLHVLIGSHGQPFHYVHSLQPDDAYGGWTEPVEALSAGHITEDTDEDGDGRQTYISLVCGPDDTLYSAFRQWRRTPDEHLPDQTFAALSVQAKPKGEEWGPAQPIVVPPVPGYSIYYHKLTIDRSGNLYLSYNHWTSDLTYQDDFPDKYHHRAIVTSRDGGKTWKLVETSDFAQAIAE